MPEFSKDAYEVRAEELETMLKQVYPAGTFSQEEEAHMLAVCEWIERYRSLSSTYIRIVRL